MDDVKIKYIEHAVWFKTMEHYPKTVGHMKLLVSIVDKMGIFNKFDLSLTSEMESKKLNILFAVLKITNKVFNKYLNHVVRSIFQKEFRPILKPHFRSSYHYNSFSDQLIQDLDHFVCHIIKIYYPYLDKIMIREKICEYLKATFQKTFYQNIMEKISCPINETFYSEHSDFFDTLAGQIVAYSHKTLDETYETMTMFLEKIFSANCTHQSVNKIMMSLEKYIDLKILFNENCLEIDIYSEQKLDDEFETNEIIYDDLNLLRIKTSLPNETITKNKSHERYILI